MISRLFDWLYVQSDTRHTTIVSVSITALAVILSVTVNNPTPAVGAIIVSFIMILTTWLVERCYERNS